MSKNLNLGLAILAGFFIVGDLATGKLVWAAVWVAIGVAQLLVYRAKKNAED